MAGVPVGLYHPALVSVTLELGSTGWDRSRWDRATWDAPADAVTDLTGDVAAVSWRTGRPGLRDHADVATAVLTLVDRTGVYDPLADARLGADLRATVTVQRDTDPVPLPVLVADTVSWDAEHLPGEPVSLVTVELVGLDASLLGSLARPVAPPVGNGDGPAERFARLLDDAAWPAELRDLGGHATPKLDPTAMTAPRWAELVDTADACRLACWVDPTGVCHLADVDAGPDLIGPTFTDQPTTDPDDVAMVALRPSASDDQLVNVVTGSRPNGQVHVATAGDPDRFGARSVTRTDLQVSSDADAQAWTSWRLVPDLPAPVIAVTVATEADPRAWQVATLGDPRTVSRVYWRGRTARYRLIAVDCELQVGVGLVATVTLWPLEAWQEATP